MNLSESTRLALTENLLIVANAVRTSDPGEDTALYELHAGIGRLLPTRPASPSEQAPVVAALATPLVPREAVELLEWLASDAPEYRGAEFVRGNSGHWKVGTFGGGEQQTTGWRTGLAEAARAALEKVNR